MKTIPQITEAEFEIIKVIWNHSPVSTTEITNILLEKTDWSPKTIHTLIKRLATKGVISYEKKGRVFVYSPVIMESEYIGHKSDSFLKRYYDGNITSMVSSFISSDKLTADDIHELRSLLEKGCK